MRVVDHAVHDDVEGDEERELGEQQNQEDIRNVSMSELIDHQVEDDDSLEDEKRLSLVALVVSPMAIACKAAIRAHADDHVDGHHRRLKHDPSLLETILQRVIVLIIVKVCISDPVFSVPVWIAPCMFRLG